MFFKKPFVNNRTIDRRFNRRVYMTQHISKIDRRRQKLSQHESLYGKLYYKTRDKEGIFGSRGDMSIGLVLVTTACGTIATAIPFGFWAAAASSGQFAVFPFCLMILFATLATWLLTIKWSYKAYYTVMGKHYERKIERVSAKQAKVLPGTFVTALSDSLDRDEVRAMHLLACYPGRVNELYGAYKDKVAVVDSIQDDVDAYREARRILVDILREDLKDILEEEHAEKEAERKADKLQAAKERQRRRAEAERNQKVLSDLRTFYDAYKQLG